MNSACHKHHALIFDLGTPEIDSLVLKIDLIPSQRDDFAMSGAGINLDLSRIDAAPVSHLGGLSFESQWAFPAQG
jgi:hypothetical protein